MLKAALWIMLILVGILAIPIAIINAQPYDDRELRSILIPPDDCPAPCFMGIRPGVTSFDQAINILQSHEWIAQMQLTKRYNNRWTYAFWEWSGSQARLPQTNYRNSLSAGIEASGDMTIHTAITPIEIWWLYGPPTWMQNIKINGGREQYIFGYPDHKLVLLVEVRDCTRRLDVLTSSARLTFARWIFNRPERLPDDYIIRPNLSYFSKVNPCLAVGQS